MKHILCLLCLVVFGTASCQQQPPHTATQLVPLSPQQWLQALRQAARDSVLSDVAVQGDTLKLSFDYSAASNIQPPVLQTNKPHLAQFKAWFVTPPLVKKDTSFEGMSCRLLRNRAGSTILFNDELGLISANLVDGSCRWKDTLSPGMSKNQLLNYYFTKKLNKNLLRKINTLQIPSGMNSNGVYFMFNDTIVAKIIEIEFPD